MKPSPISPELRAEWLKEFESLGIARLQASFEFNTFGYSTEKLLLAREWVTDKIDQRSEESLSIARESLSISRSALSNSRLATRIAISAIVLSISMAILEIIKWYSSFH